MIEAIESSNLAKLIGGECNHKSIMITNFSSLLDANKTSITFYMDPK